jgi:hypothetical protein
MEGRELALGRDTVARAQGTIQDLFFDLSDNAVSQTYDGGLEAGHRNVKWSDQIIDEISTLHYLYTHLIG